MIALDFSQYRGFCFNTGSKNKLVQAKPWKPNEIAVLHFIQAIHSLKLNPQQSRLFSVSVNSQNIGELGLPIMLCFFSNPNCTALSNSFALLWREQSSALAWCPAYRSLASMHRRY